MPEPLPRHFKVIDSPLPYEKFLLQEQAELSKDCYIPLFTLEGKVYYFKSEGPKTDGRTLIKYWESRKD
jgi:hypothetical protein